MPNQTVQLEQTEQPAQPTPEDNHPASTILPDIPKFVPANMTPGKPMHNLEGHIFAQKINKAYDTIIKWRSNLMKLPTGRAAKEFIREITSWLEHFNKGSEFAPIALKVFHTLPALLLQKPSRNSRAKDNLKKLEDRLTHWKNGDIDALLEESSVIQQRLSAGKSPEDSAKVFPKLMLQGKINGSKVKSTPH